MVDGFHKSDFIFLSLSKIRLSPSLQLYCQLYSLTGPNGGPFQMSPCILSAVTKREQLLRCSSFERCCFRCTEIVFVSASDKSLCGE